MGSNCESDGCQTLLDFRSSKPQGKASLLSLQEFTRATACNFADENGLEYFAGYVFKKMISYHSNTCELCEVHGTLLTSATTEIQTSEMFLYLKRYKGTDAKLQKVSPAFKNFVKQVVQISSYVFQRKRSISSITKTVVLAAETYIPNSLGLCQNMFPRVCRLIARTIILRNMKWKNCELKDMRKSLVKGNKKTSSVQKLSKLNHC